MKMDDKRVLRYGLKYLNLAFGILMLVVASLNIEQMTHNKRIFNSALLVNSSGESGEIVASCRACQSRALSAITTLNIEGLFLSTVLAMYSFVLAFKPELLVKHCRYLVPCCFLTMILTAVYFVLCFISKLPEQCVKFDSEVKSNKWLVWECNADFDYNLENKVVPLSVLMLVLIPQLLVRSVVIVFSYCMNRDFKTLKCNDWIDFDSTTLTHNDNDNVSYLNTSMTTTCETEGGVKRSSKLGKGQDEERVELLTTSSRQNMCESVDQVVLGTRELPVDCPPTPQLDLQLYSQATMANTDPDMFEINKNTLIERIKSELSLISPTQRFEMYTQNNNNNNNTLVATYNTAQTRSSRRSTSSSVGVYGYSMRNSSLSTISEEQTLAGDDYESNLDQSSLCGVFDNNNNIDEYEDDDEFEQNRPNTPDDWLEIRDALKDFEYKTVMLNEILQVFVPSSRDGNFSRNVPIRLSSPFKSRHVSSSSTQLAENKTDDQTVEMEEAFEAAKSAEQALSHTMSILERHFQPNALVESSGGSLSKIGSSYHHRDSNNNNGGGIMNAGDLNLMVTRKMRFVKRLKNRIETRRGRPLTSSSSFELLPPPSSNNNNDNSTVTHQSHTDHLNISDRNNNNVYSEINENISSSSSSSSQQFHHHIKPVFF